MAEYLTNSIRNLALVGHGGEGKTTLTEAMLFAAGHVDRQGRVEDGTAQMDYDPEETKRHISIGTALAPIEWNKHKVNVVDVPGYFDFAGEMCGAMRVVKTAGIVVGAVSGLTVGAEKAWQAAEKNGVCHMVIVNRMDTENANYDKVVEQFREKYGTSVVPLILPIGSGASFKGVVDVLQNKAWEGTGKGLKETDTIHVMSYKNNAWNPIAKVVNNGDGTITCTFDHLCPVAFVVDKSLSDTGDIFRTELLFWSVALIASAAALVVVVSKRRQIAG